MCVDAVTVWRNLRILSMYLSVMMLLVSELSESDQAVSAKLCVIHCAVVIIGRECFKVIQKVYYIYYRESLNDGRHLKLIFVEFTIN
jgi:hypothetical protein